MRPEIGIPVLLVYRECECGWWCATGEGAIAPVCPVCGRNALPLGGPVGMFGEPADDQNPLPGRRLRGLGFVALLTRESDAVGMVGRARALIGRTLAVVMAHDVDSRQEPYRRPGEISGLAKQMGLPAEPLWVGSLPPWCPPPADAEPDWPKQQWTDAARELLEPNLGEA